MTQEAYVSFEAAKLLKEKGFDIPCHYTYHGDITSVPFFHRKVKNFNGEEYSGKTTEWVSCPTLQMAMKWLREVHNIYYEIKLLLGEKAEKYGDLQLGIYQLNSSEAYVWKGWIYAYTYVELYENYIKYCLENLI